MIIHIIISIFLSLFSTAIMTYISMATPIGPWINGTLVLIGFILFKLFLQPITTQSMTLVVASGSIGGILATACGFSFPAIYFLEPAIFKQWMHAPSHFILLLGGLSLSAGWFGIWIANVLEKNLLIQEDLPFPIGQLIYKMITAHNQAGRAYELVVGLIGALITGIMQTDIGKIKGLLPKIISCVPAFHYKLLYFPAVVLDMSILPMSVAIGFVTGYVIAFPLLIGTLFRILLLDPLHQLYFSYISSTEFLLAFCSGMILAGALLSLLSLPQLLFIFCKKILTGYQSYATLLDQTTAKNHIQELLLWFIFSFCYFSWLGYSLLVQLYLFGCTYACCYVMTLIAGKIGIAHLGRYATFVMVPAMFIFPLTYVQIIYIATFVEIAGGVSVDTLFGRKLAQLSNTNSSLVKRYQYLGLIISSVCVGVVFWLLVNHFQLGSSQLFAYKAQARHLLIHAKNFDYTVLLLGAVVGYLLKYVRINPGLVLGGLLMPINISIGLIIGGGVAYMCTNKERWYPLFSGIFAGNSLWMIIHAFFGR